MIVEAERRGDIQPRRHADRADVRQHRNRARDGRGDEGLPDDPGDAGPPVDRAPAGDARVRRRAHPRRRRRAAWSTRAISRSEMRDEGKGIILDQFANPDNPLAHYRGTGPEIWRDTQRDDHALRVGDGHDRHDHGRVALSEGEESRDPDHRRAAGGRLRRFPASASGPRRTCRRSTIRRASTGSSRCRRRTPRRWRAGSRPRKASSAASRRAARARSRCASRAEVANATIVFVVCDRGDRYLSTGVFPGGIVTPILVFDIETVPDAAGLAARASRSAPSSSDAAVVEWMTQKRRGAERVRFSSASVSAGRRDRLRAARRRRLQGRVGRHGGGCRARAHPPLLRPDRQAHAAARVVERRRLRSARAQLSRADSWRHGGANTGTGATTTASSSSTATSAATTRATSTSWTCWRCTSLAPPPDSTRWRGCAAFRASWGWTAAKCTPAIAAGKRDDVRRYCETDVMNTYLVYLRFRRLRGELTAGEYAKEVSLARERIAAIGAPHWLEFIAAWDANAA